MKISRIAMALGLLMFLPAAAWAQTDSPLAINVMSNAAFVDNAAWNDMFAIQSSRLALEKSGDPKIREFAQTMIRDHARDSARLADATALTLPMALDRLDALLLDKLLLASPGPDFDQLYAKMQIEHYEQALQLHRAYSMTGENTALKQLAMSLANRSRQRLDKASQLAPAPSADRLASGEK